MATLKASLSTSVPKPKNQGGHSSSAAVTQKTGIQSKLGPAKPGAAKIVFTDQPKGTKGSGTNAGKPMKTK